MPSAYTGGKPSSPRAVDAIQYYRASSAVLILDGYNDTAVLSTVPNVTVQSLPANVDRMLLICLNATIGAAIPLVDAPAKYHISVGGYVVIVFGGLIGLVLLAILALYITVKCMDWKHGWDEKRGFKTLFADFKSLCQGQYSKKSSIYQSVSNPSQDVHSKKHYYMYPTPTLSPSPTPVRGLNATYYIDIRSHSPAIA